LLLAGCDAAIDGGPRLWRTIIGDQPASLCRFEQAITHLLFVEGATANELAKIKRGVPGSAAATFLHSRSSAAFA
jgi:hypothetical protein